MDDYRVFTHHEAKKWGLENYGDWLVRLQNQDYQPCMDIEKFFRKYTQGIHYVFNRLLRDCSIDTYDFKDSCMSKSMFEDSILDIKDHYLKENIVVYRYVDKILLKKMKTWSWAKNIRQKSILVDRGFFSTTLCLDSVSDRHYANRKGTVLLEIYVPKDTACVYLDLISDMDENELLFLPNTKIRVIRKELFKGRIICKMEST